MSANGVSSPGLKTPAGIFSTNYVIKFDNSDLRVFEAVGILEP